MITRPLYHLPSHAMYGLSSAGYAGSSRKRGRSETVTTVVRKTPAKKMTIRRPLARTGGYTGRFSGPKAELKFFDTSISFLIDATGEVPATGQLVLIPQGVTESTRIGRSCVIKSLEFRLIATYGPGAAVNMSDISLISVVQDKQTNGAVATADLVYLATNNLPVQQRNLENVDRFKILKEFRHVWNAGAGVTTAYDPVSKSIRKRIKCNIPMLFDSSASTGALGTIRTNNVFLLAGTYGNSDDLIAVNGTCRVRFSDA